MSGTQQFQLKIRCGKGRQIERAYIFDTILRHFWGVAYTVEYSEALCETSIELPNGQCVYVDDSFFSQHSLDWLSVSSLPALPLKIWVLPEKQSRLIGERQLPILYGQVSDFLQKTPDGLRLRLDVFGSAFFMLTRYEELVSGERDQHDRFPAHASVAFKAGFLGRPILNEYMRILEDCLTSLWPEFRVQQRSFRAYVTHDVDSFRWTDETTWLGALKSSVYDAFVNRRPLLALQKLTAKVFASLGIDAFDPYDSFSFLLKETARNKLTSSYYFQPRKTGLPLDGIYELQDERVQKLFRRLKHAGCEVGFHPTFNTYKSLQETELEASLLKKSLLAQGLELQGGRQHYLRWQNPVTWRNWAALNLSYDSTLGYHDQIGFRSGTCFSYPVFDLEERRALALLERPLVVMDTTLFRYMQMPWNEIEKNVMDLAKRCAHYDGEFTLLWHNNNLTTRQARSCFKKVVGGLSQFY